MMHGSAIRVLAPTAGVAVSMALLAGAAAAAVPAPVAFDDSEQVVSFTPGPGCFAVFQGPGLGCPIDVLSEGTAIARGAITGSFSVVANGQLEVGPVNSLTEVLTGDTGTITIGMQARFVGGTATTETLVGDWTIVRGSGSYADLHGNGTSLTTVNFGGSPHVLSETLTGIAVFGSGS